MGAIVLSRNVEASGCGILGGVRRGGKMPHLAPAHACCLASAAVETVTVSTTKQRAGAALIAGSVLIAP